QNRWRLAGKCPGRRQAVAQVLDHEEHPMKRTVVAAHLVGATVMMALPAWGQSASSVNSSGSEIAQADAPKPSYGGDFSTRSKLTGDWGGARDRWAQKGVTIDFDAFYTLQWLADGGTGSGEDLGNTLSGDLVFQLDTGKAGLWPGGFAKMRI